MSQPAQSSTRQPLAPAAVSAIRDQLVGLLKDPDIQEILREILGPAQSIEIGAAEAEQILDLVEKKIGAVFDKRIEHVVRSLVRPDYLLRPYLRPDDVKPGP